MSMRRTNPILPLLLGSLGFGGILVWPAPSAGFDDVKLYNGGLCRARNWLYYGQVSRGAGEFRNTGAGGFHVLAECPIDRDSVNRTDGFVEMWPRLVNFNGNEAICATAYAISVDGTTVDVESHCTNPSTTYSVPYFNSINNSDEFGHFHLYVDLPPNTRISSYRVDEHDGGVGDCSNPEPDDFKGYMGASCSAHSSSEIPEIARSQGRLQNVGATNLLANCPVVRDAAIVDTVGPSARCRVDNAPGQTSRCSLYSRGKYGAFVDVSTETTSSSGLQTLSMDLTAADTADQGYYYIYTVLGPGSELLSYRVFEEHDG